MLKNAHLTRGAGQNDYPGTKKIIYLQKKKKYYEKVRLCITKTRVPINGTLAPFYIFLMLFARFA